MQRHGRVLLMLVVLVVLTLILSAANGGNDVSRGIATLVGSGVSNYRGAVIWGTIWTIFGALAASMASQGLVASFSGRALVRGEAPGVTLLLAVAAGAIGWLIITVLTGLPVSTTHSLFGALIGASLVHSGAGGILWNVAGTKIVVPLLFSPVVSMLLLFAVLPLFGAVFRRFSRYCVCIEESVPVACGPEGAVAAREMLTAPRVEVGANCEPATVARVNVIDTVHWTTAAATSFFRGMNDAPKILAIGLAAGAGLGLATSSFYFAVAVAMGLGSLFAGFRVTQTLAKKITPIAPANGSAANFVTSVLVGIASMWSLPVSTTHVSSGAILGVGVATDRKSVRWKVVGEIGLAWIVTLPISGLLAAAVYALIR